MAFKLTASILACDFMLVILMGLVDLIAAILIYAAFDKIPGPDFLKIIVIAVLIYKFVVSTVPAILEKIS